MRRQPALFVVAHKNYKDYNNIKIEHIETLDYKRRH